MVLESIFGTTLIKNGGTETPTSELSTAEGAVIGLYFSAHWCPPCKGYTPKLVDLYKELNQSLFPEPSFAQTSSPWFHYD